MSENRPFRRGRPTLAERVAASGGGVPDAPGPGLRAAPVPDDAPRGRPAAPPRPSSPPAAAGELADAKHCWVVDDPRWPGRRAALLLGWVRDGRLGWVGRVALAPGPGAEIVLAHVAAAHLDADR